MTHVTCSLTAKNRDQLRNPMLGNRVWATFTFYMPDIPVLHVEGSESPPITWFLGPTWVHTQNGTSIGLVILAQLMVVTNRHTHRPRNTGNNRPHLFSMRVIQPNNSELCWWRFSSLPPVIYQFKRLEILMANDNQIGDVDAESLCQMPMIATLALQNNNISAVPPQLGNCTQLRFQLVLFTKTWKRLEMRDFSLCLIKKLSLIEK